jgi:predicted acylesterase/phospholipase RssA
MAKKIRVWDGTSWQQVGVSAALPNAFNVTLAGNSAIESGKRYFVDTTAARTLTLPASASAGDEIVVFDASGTSATYNITVASNSNKINGVIQDLTIDANFAAVVLVYIGATYGWRVN